MVLWCDEDGKLNLRAFPDTRHSLTTHYSLADTACSMVPGLF
jgi:hypothetical protein